MQVATLGDLYKLLSRFKMRGDQHDRRRPISKSCSAWMLSSREILELLSTLERVVLGNSVPAVFNASRGYMLGVSSARHSIERVLVCLKSIEQ